jgi:chromosome segregation ATPase
MPNQSVLRAHDALMALMPEGAAHEDCPLCTVGHDAEQEVASVADTTPSAPAGNVYSEAQHFSLVKSAIEQETAALSVEKSELTAKIETLESEKAALATELSEAKSTIDVLESDKATAEAAAETAKKNFDDFKAELERKAEVETKKSSRKERVKAANEHLTDGYFTDERITRWAEMSDDGFDALVNEMTEFAAAAKPTKGQDDDKQNEAEKTAEKARESAAFTGGETASATDMSNSTLSLFLAKRQAAV